MPRYYFETHDGATIHDDCEGLELADKATAGLEALRVLSDMVRDVVRDTPGVPVPGDDRRVLSSVVRNEGGHVVYVAALTLEGKWVRPVSLVATVDPDLCATGTGPDASARPPSPRAR